MKTQFISERLFPSHCWLKSSRRRTFVPLKSNWIIGSWWRLWKVLQPAISTLRGTKARDMAEGGRDGGLALSIQHSFSRLLTKTPVMCAGNASLHLFSRCAHIWRWSRASGEDRCRRPLLCLSHHLCCSSTSQIRQPPQSLYYLQLWSGWYFIDHCELIVSPSVCQLTFLWDARLSRTGRPS